MERRGRARAGRPWATITAEVYPEHNGRPLEGFRLGSDMSNHLLKDPLRLCVENGLRRTKEPQGPRWNAAAFV